MPKKTIKKTIAASFICAALALPFAATAENYWWNPAAAAADISDTTSGNWKTGTNPSSTLTESDNQPGSSDNAYLVGANGATSVLALGSPTRSVLRQPSGSPRPRERGPRLPPSGPRRKCSLTRLWAEVLIGSLPGGARRGRGEAEGGGAQSDEQGLEYRGAGLAEGKARLRRAVRQRRAPWGRAGRRISVSLLC